MKNHQSFMSFLIKLDNVERFISIIILGDALIVNIGSLVGLV